MSYQEIYGRSLSDPNGFWGEAAAAFEALIAEQRTIDPELWK